MKRRQKSIPPEPPDQLTLYGTGWCPEVRRTRAFLDRKDVEYRYLDLDQDSSARATARRLQHGRRRIPMLVFPDGSFLVEPDEEALRAALSQARDAGKTASGTAS